MKTLEIKHVAPYLPYGVDMKWGSDIINLIGISGNTVLASTEYWDKPERISFDNIRPILRNLSDLTKEIEHNGERFLPYLYWDDKNRIDLLSECATDVIYVEYLEYFIVEKLLEWHFDIFGLINAGLAIDMNTLK